MRRFKRFVPGLASVAVLAIAAYASANGSASIIGQAKHTASLVATLTVTGSSHNVTANSTGPDGKALFRSATISGGSTPVNGTQFIPAGSYGFHCTVHPTTMNAVLNVAGTPLPRPAVTLKILSKTLGGKIKARVTSASSSGAPSGSIFAKLGKTKLTKDAGLAVAPGGSSTIKLKLSSAGRRKLSGRTSARIKVTAAPDFGSPVSKKKTLN
jgi:hypothetical protein